MMCLSLSQRENWTPNPQDKLCMNDVEQLQFGDTLCRLSECREEGRAEHRAAENSPCIGHT